MELMPYYGVVPFIQFQELQRDQDHIRNQNAATAEKQVNLSHALSLLAPDLREAGLDSHSASPQDAAEYDVAVGKIDRAVQLWRHNNNNKLPDDCELLQIGRQTLFPERFARSARQPPPKSSSGGSTGTAYKPVQMLDEELGDAIGQTLASVLQMLFQSKSGGVPVES
jgi:hypothetical protein